MARSAAPAAARTTSGVRMSDGSPRNVPSTMHAARWRECPIAAWIAAAAPARISEAAVRPRLHQVRKSERPRPLRERGEAALMSAGAPSNAPPRHCSDHAEAKLTDRYSVPPTYFSWLEMPEKVPLRLVPSDKTTAMMAAAMPAATRPYSIRSLRVRRQKTYTAAYPRVSSFRLIQLSSDYSCGTRVDHRPPHRNA